MGYITIDIVNTIRLHFETENNLYQTFLFFLTLSCYFIHGLLSIWTITYEIKYIPKVTKFHPLQTPKIINKQKK